MFGMSSSVLAVRVMDGGFDVKGNTFDSIQMTSTGFIYNPAGATTSMYLICNNFSLVLFLKEQ